MALLSGDLGSDDDLTQLPEEELQALEDALTGDRGG